jgi:hypothetical protein
MKPYYEGDKFKQEWKPRGMGRGSKLLWDNYIRSLNKAQRMKWKLWILKQQYLYD